MRESLMVWDGEVGVSHGIRGGGGSHAAASPSFLVLI
jgi:hypothetical protein